MNHPRSFDWFAYVLCAALATACGKDEPSPTDAGDSGSEPQAGQSGEPQAGNTGEGGDGASGSGGNDALDGGSGDFDASQDAGDYVPDPLFEGVPTDSVQFGTATAGCLEKAGDEADTLLLTFDATLTTVQLAAQDGIVEVNGIKCRGVTNPTKIKVVGGNAAETLIVDFSIGEFPPSLRDGTIEIDLGAGSDTLAVAGTYEMDDVHLGTRSGASALRIAAGLPKLTTRNQEALIVSTGPGDDHIDASGSDDVGAALTIALLAYGGAGFDMFTGGSGADVLHGGEGDDLFKAGSAADGGDTYEGGQGVDTLTYELRKSPVIVKVDAIANDGEPGERDDVQNSVETIVGGQGNDTLTGGEADNTLVGGPGNDALNGGNGDDRFYEPVQALGSDAMNGGNGFDLVDYGQRSGDIRVSLCVPAQASCVAGPCGCTADDGENNERDTFAHVEGAITGLGDDVLLGSAADNYFSGGAGSDELRGEAGNDTLYGEDGNDILIGGVGEDLLDGALGTDSFDAGGGQGDICVVVPSLESPLGCELY